MTIYTFKDKFWPSAALGADNQLTPWLRDTGSLTQRIQQRCAHFCVSNTMSGVSRISRDESALLGLAPQQRAWSREVFLYADDQPVVFAHSTCALLHLRGAWAEVRNLGNQSLAGVLFSHPQVVRHPLHYKALHRHHPLYRRAAAALPAAPDRLWSRRSLFYLHHAPLLVTEVFLPEILRLKK
ncbi:MAG: chorismate lyase [Gallionella sp.]